jgi:hypothetical protein
MARLWQRPDAAGTAHLARAPMAMSLLAVGVIALVVIIGLVVGTAMRT